MQIAVNLSPRNPCRSCKNRRNKDLYPDCGDDCHSLNSYLANIGLPPRKKTDTTQNLRDLYPPDKKHGYRYPAELCTPEQYLDAGARLREIRAQTGMKGNVLAKAIGISEALCNSIRRASDKTTAKENYQKIMDYEF